MASSKENNWGGMGQSKTKLTTPKTSVLKSSTAKNAVTAKKGYTNASGGKTKIADPWDVSGITGQSKVIPGTEWAIGLGQPGWGQEGFVPTVPKPSNAGIVKPTIGVPALLQKPVAAVPSPSQVISGTGKGGAGTGAQAKSIYDYLNVDPTQIYSPLTKLIDDQRKAANERYAKNLGDITNIFSALTSIAPADRTRINTQFKDMLTAQQTALASRTAAATEQGQAGAAQAVATGAERGGGDAMVLNPLQTATAQGIADSNAISSVWEGLQGANQAQALNDITNRDTGYTAQQLAAVQGLQSSLGDRLAGLAGNEADIQSQLAQQKFNIAQDIGKAKYSNALALQQAQAAAASRVAPTVKVPAIDKIRTTLGTPRFNALTNQLQTAYNTAYSDINPATATGAGKSPNVGDVVARWVNGGGNPDLINEARTLVENMYGK